MSEDRWDPRPVRRVLGALIDDRRWHERLAVGRLKSAWGEVVGDSIAAHSEPLKLAGGQLLVRAEPGAWATELTLLARQVATRANGHLGGGLVREVKVIARAT